MVERLVQMADNFWNVRGSFKVGGLLNVGTQTSLVRRARGDFVLLDSYAFGGEVENEVMRLTDGGRSVVAVLNLHPFHTVHVKHTAERFAEAKLYGTRRHHELAPGLSWQPELTEGSSFRALFEEDFVFSVPRGVDFIPANSNLHFSSVLAFHPSSHTLHVDDTLTWISLPLVGGLRFHPTLAKTLKRSAGAVAEFREWLDELTELCAPVRHLCTAHMHALPPWPRPLAPLLHEAREKIEKTLSAHEKRFG